MPKREDVIVVFNLKKHQEWSASLSVIMQLGLTMAGCIFFCFWIGHLLDSWLGTRGVFITIFILLGIIGGGVTVYKQILEITAPENTKENNHRNKGV